jgi:hypothetical protein
MIKGLNTNVSLTTPQFLANVYSPGVGKFEDFFLSLLIRASYGGFIYEEKLIELNKKVNFLQMKDHKTYIIFFSSMMVLTRIGKRLARIQNQSEKRRKNRSAYDRRMETSITEGLACGSWTWTWTCVSRRGAGGVPWFFRGAPTSVVCKYQILGCFTVA